MTQDLAQAPDLTFLNEYERLKIIEVLRRDEILRKKQSDQIAKLKQEIDLLESRSIDIPSEHIESAKNCSRCKSLFGYFFNTGEFCAQCGFKVCQKCKADCKVFEDNFLRCVLCFKYK